MAGHAVDRRVLLLPSPSTACLGFGRLFASVCQPLRSDSEGQSRGSEGGAGNGVKGKWFVLPPFDALVDGAALGRKLAAQSSSATSTATTAMKWVACCCPELPRSLVQKLFRLRQVKREVCSMDQSDSIDESPIYRLKRIAAKDPMNVGDRVYLPITVKDLPSHKEEGHFNLEEVNFVRGLELYKDSSIIAINKPPGMPVQGGTGIRRSLDELAVSILKYDFPEPPRLVHRLDRDCSGILVMGRTRTSATILHSIFREKTAAALDDDIQRRKRALQRKYLALVIGSPRKPRGLISVPLKKIVVDDGKSDMITVFDNIPGQTNSSQHAITEYKVICSYDGYTWLEMTPLTGRKHQLRVHCAEVLGTPIVGDYKYGWRAHRNWKVFLPKEGLKEQIKGEILPFGLDLESGTISCKQPRLHLHCKQIRLPNLSKASLNIDSSSRYDVSELESLELVAPLPAYMQKSLDILKSL
ncbi:hypothetical protein SAY87_020945 [Trapa incisa]|uniref:Pseudouridine synthase RsuA/RluA-like domain-containing protein n=1 Tax=Trapa incisa TaxID=236973 RepID=A0AAN7PNP7_9MYRT|nr:hypothetical protein SAY87_020945 [Trapa incisa]